MTIHWKAVEQFFTVAVVFQFYPVCNFGNFFNFGLGSERSEIVKMWNFHLTNIKSCKMVWLLDVAKKDKAVEYKEHNSTQ